MTVAACLKWLTPADGDDRFGGISAADEAALELALRLGAARGEDVLAVTLGPPAAEAAARNALALGVQRAVHIVADATIDSFDVALALAGVVRDASFVCCGDYSLDRGSGSVPVFLAALLEARQATGLIEVTAPEGTGALTALRRLDGGRRERLRVEAPAVVSLEGATLPLRRASLAATLAARSVEVQRVNGPAVSARPATVRPYRPRARVLPAPAGATALERLHVLLDSGATVVAHGDAVTLEPAAAADRILAALADWGYTS